MNKSDWFGSNGNSFFDWGGFRYCVAYHGKDHYEVRQNGKLIDGIYNVFNSLEAAKEFAERISGYSGRLCDSV